VQPIGSASAGRYFRDAACTAALIPVFLDPNCSTNSTCSACTPPPPKYFRDVPSTCSTSPSPGTHLYPVGAQFAAATVYTLLGAQCVGQTAPMNVLFYDGSSTTEIAPASFVAFMVTTQTQ
jgi:hypothetical protein